MCVAKHALPVVQIIASILEMHGGTQMAIAAFNNVTGGLLKP